MTIIQFITEVFCYDLAEDDKAMEKLMLYSKQSKQSTSIGLQYANMYKDSRIQNILKISYIFYEMFHVLPSNITIRDILNYLDKDNNLLNAFKTVIVFLNFIEFNKVYNEALAHVTFFSTLHCKANLFKRFAFRYGASPLDIEKSADSSLFGFFTYLKESQKANVSDAAVIPLLSYKPIEMKGTNYTLIDILSHSLYTNTYLLKQIYDVRRVACVFNKTHHLYPIMKTLCKKRNSVLLLTDTFVSPSYCNIMHTEHLHIYLDLFPKNKVQVLEINDDFVEQHLKLSNSPQLDIPITVIESAMSDFIDNKIFINQHIYKMYSMCYDKPLPYGKITENTSQNKVENVVVLIDNRPNALSYMSAVITGVLGLQNKDTWNLFIMTSRQAEPYYQYLFETFHKCHVIIDTEHPLLNCVEGSFVIEDYNSILKDNYMWKVLLEKGYKNALIIQDDGMLVRRGVEDQFLNKYDYVGAPWHFQNASMDNQLKAVANPQMVGNGGLSLRSVQMHYEITRDDDMSIKNAPYNNGIQPIPEDVYFSGRVYQLKGRIPDRQTANRFSSEMNINMNSIGFHKHWAYCPWPMTLAHEYFEKLYKELESKEWDQRE